MPKLLPDEDQIRYNRIRMLLGHMIFPDYLCKWNAHKYISYEITDKKKKKVHVIRTFIPSKI